MSRLMENMTNRETELSDILSNIKGAFWQLPVELKFGDAYVGHADDRDNHSILFGEGNKGIRFQYVTDEAKSPNHNVLHVPSMPIHKIANFLAVASPMVVDELVKEIERLQPFEAEAKQWKANHACEVDRARILKERPDMPIERVAAYQRMVELEKENKRLQDEFNSLQGAISANFKLDQLQTSTYQMQYKQEQTLNLLREVFNRR